MSASRRTTCSTSPTAWCWPHERNALDKVQFEMLEGMANHQRRALFEICREPAALRPGLQEGELHQRHRLPHPPPGREHRPGKLPAPRLQDQGRQPGVAEAGAGFSRVVRRHRRDQRRPAAHAGPPPAAGRSAAVARGWQNFVNEPDTDFALPQNGEWAKQIIARSGSRCATTRRRRFRWSMAGEEILEGRTVRDCLDPSRPGVVVGRYRQATDDDVARAVECAAADPDGWRTLPAPAARFELLGKVAQELRKARGDLMGAALANGGKTLAESDPEVSEAVDFLEFYRDTARWWQEMPTLRARAKGVVVVVSPWNFPIAIPCGGVAAALAAGNTVILKPASDTVLVAWELCQCFWRAGVSKKALQFVPCSGGKEGRLLVNHPKVNAVILTGGTATALRDAAATIRA